ncbi:SDR family oxidoreductase [Geobacter sp. AOG1]|uniref:SDR family oxidoreductase n=1 Tax=Geobacter sp. AOG1 TaxID=1566346 RepID=UPI001CC407A0|nr:SDR family oxidoreductase [Geobacter sp. AOG1]GFE58868.1 NAD(P)-dependent oxidoreductase [Geobacter sp. AOG1]
MAGLQKVLIIGCGDIGRRLAGLVQAQNGRVIALVRSDARRDTLQEIGIQTLQGNLDEPSSLADLPTNDAVIFYFAPPPGGGFTDPRVRAFCAAVPAGAEPAKIVYMSTSGVYGDCGDRQVTEETPPNPQTARAKRRLDAETTFLEWGRERNVPVVILRVTGIYGPGRFPVTQLASGQPVLREAPLTNRIHADDLARVCLAAAEKGEAGEIFNVSDGHPGTMTEYFNAVADALGYPRPRQVTMEEAREVMSPLMLSYVSESRRMDNSKMLTRLGIKLLYPTLADGMRKSSKTD